ncbi:hypothetical protein LCGC14_0871710 [marine sediment metagenome]|uniref:Uncharacterized protein n=1 Tax=marine sediment metagenome TaxID=412755 RepID=A0A0F9RP41_9ZZZZ
MARKERKEWRERKYPVIHGNILKSYLTENLKF